MNNFYTHNELIQLGLQSIGNNVLISKKCSIYQNELLTIGNNVRIDDFCILSGKITIGDYVHISAYSVLFGKFGIEIGNFCGLSPRTTIFSATDDFSGEYMISPLVPKELTNIIGGLVKLEDYVQLGANTIVLPECICREGSITGALSLVLTDLEPWSMNIGIPAKKYKERSRHILNLKETICK